MTSSRRRVTTARPVRQSVCFQLMPLSCSWRQMTFFVSSAVPSESIRTPLKYYDDVRLNPTEVKQLSYLDDAKAITPKCQIINGIAETTITKVEGLLAMVRRSWICVGNGLEFVRTAIKRQNHLTISLILNLYIIGLPSYRISCRTAPSRGLNVTRIRHFCH